MSVSRVIIQEKVVTQTALGQTVVWKMVEQRYCRKLPVDVVTKARYQQLSTEVTHRFVFGGLVTVELGTHRLVHGPKIYEPAATARALPNGDSEVVTNEIGDV